VLQTAVTWAAPSALAICTAKLPTAERRRLLERRAGGLGDQPVGRRRGVLGEGPAIDLAEDLVAHPEPVDPVGDGDDDTGQVTADRRTTGPAQPERCPGEHRQAAGEVPVGGVDGGSVHLHEHLARRHRGHRDVGDGDDLLRRAVAVLGGRAHRRGNHRTGRRLGGWRGGGLGHQSLLTA
jgi:hypothetical protein